jgi:hypothetical protein
MKGLSPRCKIVIKCLRMLIYQEDFSHRGHSFWPRGCRSWWSEGICGFYCKNKKIVVFFRIFDSFPYFDINFVNKPRVNLKYNVRRGQNKNAVPAERSALSFAHHALCRRQDKTKRKLININKTKLFSALNKALERSFTCLHA